VWDGSDRILVAVNGPAAGSKRLGHNLGADQVGLATIIRTGSEQSILLNGDRAITRDRAPYRP